MMRELSLELKKVSGACPGCAFAAKAVALNILVNAWAEIKVMRTHP
jgi:hypothetical protein